MSLVMLQFVGWIITREEPISEEFMIFDVDNQIKAFMFSSRFVIYQEREKPLDLRYN